MKKKAFDTYMLASARGKRAIVRKMLKDLLHRPSAYWQTRMEDTAFAMVSIALRQVPAYQKFIANRGIAKMRSMDDFRALPEMTKDNYLRAHPYTDLLLNHSPSGKTLVYTATSGSTGKPFYFPRDHVIDLQSSIYHEVMMRNMRIDPAQSTLVIIGFGMGVWIGGVITYEAFKSMGERGLPFSIITPGSKKDDIIRILKDISHEYDQVILCGYPPFLKDVIDDAESAGFNWGSVPVKLICAAETFSESFRDYLARKLGADPLRDIANIYGSADIGTMAHETPLCILLRRLALEHRNLFMSLFPDIERLPTLVQFHPDFVMFETVEGRILLTGYNALPLIRYQIGDSGGVFTFADILAACEKQGIDLRTEIRRAGIEDTATELPFVYVYERIDFSTKLYGAIIYPEHVRRGFEEHGLLDKITGKFTLRTAHDTSENECLEIHVELRQDVEDSEALRTRLRDAAIVSMREHDAEYAYLYQHMQERVTPTIICWKHGDPKYFGPGTKQRWVEKTVSVA